MKLDVVPTPTLLNSIALEGWLCAVVDVLRATSTIVAALEAGAVEIHPCLTAQEARARAALWDRGAYVLGGEEKGLRIEGFDLGNSPLEYLDNNAVPGKAIFLSTTNGTGALRLSQKASGIPVYIGALVNLSAVSSAMVRESCNGPEIGIAVVCAGLRGGLSAEDLFCAGLVIEKIQYGLVQCAIPHRLGDGACVATQFAEANKDQPLSVLRNSEHGRYLESLGFTADIEFAAQLDRYSMVPVFDGERILPLLSHP
jgi:2-phosphosulfolactate phosphatase